MNNKKSILITGGCGYIGSLLCPLLLKKKYKLIVVDNLFYKQNTLLDYVYDKNFTFYRDSISNYNLMKDLVSKSDIIIPPQNGVYPIALTASATCAAKCSVGLEAAVADS